MKCTSVPVLARGLKSDFLFEDKGRRSLFRSVSVGLPLLRIVDTVQADAFSAAVVQDFDGVAVEDGENGAGEIERLNSCS